VKKVIFDAVLSLLEEIRLNTSDSCEASGVSSALARIRSADAVDLEQTLKDIRNELFHHKGPLYDSCDESEDLISLREKTCVAFKDLINTVIRARN
jgi:hypothetical protein